MENQAIDKIKEKLPHGSYKMISKKMNEKYKPRTIEKMFGGKRTMKPEVLEASIEFLKSINIEVK